jgi:hypothetical protein
MRPGLPVAGRLFSPPVGVQIPLLAEMPLSACGCRKFQIDPPGDHLCTCTVHSGAKKAHDWAVDQIADLFRKTHKVKTHQVVSSRDQRCGDIQLAGYLANAAGPVPLVLDLRIAHDCFGSSSDPSINGHLHYPNDLDRSLNEAATDKIRQYRAECNIHPSNTISLCLLLLVRLGGYIVNLSSFYFCKLIGKLTAFLKLQEFSLRNLQVASSTAAAQRSPHSSILRSPTSSPRLQHYGLTSISTAPL